jgi:hypothetical protein
MSDMKLKPNSWYWTEDRPYVEGKSVLHEGMPPKGKRNTACWVCTDENGAIVKFKQVGNAFEFKP